MIEDRVYVVILIRNSTIYRNWIFCVIFEVTLPYSSMIKKIFISLIVIASVVKQAKAQTYVAIPDSNFVHYLKTIVPTAFKGDSLNTSSTLVTTTTHSMNVSYNSISNLNGTQYFTSLVHLECVECGLINLPTLPNSLTYLNCNGNNFVSLSNLPNSLDTLFCSVMNTLTNLSTLPNHLILLSCPNTNLSSLPALPNTLTYLDCSNSSHITNLPALSNSLIQLYCHSNNITCFPTFPNSITNLDIDPNPYNCLPNYIHAMGSDTATYPLCAVGNSNGCEVTSISQISGLNTQISIYPNPNNGNFVVEPNSATKQTMQIYDVTGKLVLTQTINGKTTIDASSLNEGVYNISIGNNEGVINKRLVIVK